MMDSLPQVEVCCGKYDDDDERNGLLNMSGAEGRVKIRLEQTEFPMKRLMKRMGLRNSGSFNQWSNV